MKDPHEALIVCKRYFAAYVDTNSEPASRVDYFLMLHFNVNNIPNSIA